MGSLILLLLSVLPRTAALQEPVHVIPVLELNYQYRWNLNDEDRYELTTEFVQWIAWERYPPITGEDTGIHVWCWARHQPCHVLENRNGYWYLSIDDQHRPVKAIRYFSTWTQFDPEVADARILPKTQRKKAIPGWRR